MLLCGRAHAHRVLSCLGTGGPVALDLVCVIVVVVAAAVFCYVPTVPALQSSNGEQTLKPMRLPAYKAKRGVDSFSRLASTD